MGLVYGFSSYNTNSFFIKLRIKHIIRTNYANTRIVFDDFYNIKRIILHH